MKNIILPGFSIHNKNWANALQNHLNKYYIRTHIVSWDHWTTGNPRSFMENNEAKNVANIIGNENFNIVAKSIGTLISLKVLETKLYLLNKLVLCGIPINDLNQLSIKKYEILAKIPTDKILVIQNSDDPHGNYNQVLELFKNLNLVINVIEKKAATHEYFYFEEIDNFLKQQS